MRNHHRKNFRLEYAGIVLSFLIAYVQLFDILEKSFIIEKPIVLEFDKSESTPDTLTYVVTGAVADENYLLDMIKLFPIPDNLKQVSFQYDHYPEFDLKPITNTTPDTYKVSKDFLEKKYNEDNFHFEFLDNNRFTFKFKFIGNEQNKSKFECKVFTVKNTSIPCEVKEKGGFFSMIRDIPWYWIGVALSLVLVFFIHFFDRLLGIWNKKPPNSPGYKNVTPNKSY